MKTHLIAGCAALLLLALVNGNAQDAETSKPAKVIKTKIGAFTELGVNDSGHREFRREKDGATVVLIPGGEFIKRQYVGDPLAPDETWALHIDAFLIDKFETTNAQVVKYLNGLDGLNVSHGSVHDETTLLAKDHKWGLKVADGKVSVQIGYESHPSVGTTGHLALAYAKWVGGDLPYGHEFEKAAAGPDGQIFPWGDQLPDRELANYWMYGPRKTEPVGSHPTGVSPYGVHDLAGNVYDRAYWTEGPNDIEPDMVPWMIKGGSWVTPHWANLRCVDRCAQQMDDTDGSVGFRVVIRDQEVLKALGAKPSQSLRMHDDVDKAFEEAASRNVPILLFLCYETCGQCDRTRAQVFTDDAFIEYMNEHAVVLIGHNPGDGWQDPVEIPTGPSMLFPGCRVENLSETFDYFCRAVNTRVVPRAIMEFEISPGQFALNPHLDLQEEPEQLILIPEDGFPKGGGDVASFIQKMKEAQAQLGEGQTRSDFVAGNDAPATKWAPPED